MHAENQHIAVFGLGRIGLPIGLFFAQKNRVIGIDVSADTLRSLSDQTVPFHEPGLQDLLVCVGSSFVSEPILEEDADIFIIAVPTHLGQTLNTNVLFDVVEQIAALSSGGTVLVMSTVPPGTTDEVANRLLEHDVFYMPERLRPGFALHDLENAVRIVGTTKDAIVPTWIDNATVADAAIVEAAKIVENSFRDVNVAFANATANALHDIGLDARAVFEIANSHARVDVHTAGIGAGGFCLPKATHALAALSDSPLFQIARDTNERQIVRVAARLKTLQAKRIALWGVAYKPDVDIDSNSPARALETLLIEADVETVVWDPIMGIGTREESIFGADAIVIGCAHQTFEKIDPASIANPCTVIDFFGVLDHAKWQNHGFYCIPR